MEWQGAADLGKGPNQGATGVVGFANVEEWTEIADVAIAEEPAGIAKTALLEPVRWWKFVSIQERRAGSRRSLQIVLNMGRHSIFGYHSGSMGTFLSLYLAFAHGTT